MKYQIELTEEQVKVVQNALDEYFRLRMGQEWEFCYDMASVGRDVMKEEFDTELHRRNHLREIMKAFFRIAFEPLGYLQEKTDSMMIAECIWDALRFARGQSRWNDVMQIGPEPVPTIRKVDDEHD